MRIFETEADAALAPLPRAAKQARHVGWATLYLAASQLVAMGIGLTTGAWILSRPGTDPSTSFTGTIIGLAFWLGVSFWVWKKSPRWIAVLVVLVMVAEAAYKLYGLTQGGRASAVMLLPFIFTAYSIHGALGTFRLAKLRREAAAVPA